MTTNDVPGSMDEIAYRYTVMRESIKALARESGLSATSIAAYLRRRGIAIRSKNEQRAIDSQMGRQSQSQAIRTAWKRGVYESLFVVDEKKGRTFRPELRAAISRRASARVGPANPFFGRKHSARFRGNLSRLAQARSIAGNGEYPKDWRAIRARIIERDSMQCQVCARATRVEVHHVDHDRSNNDDDNLMTLCTRCHLGYHGRGERAKEILEAQAALRTRLRALRPTC